MILLPILAFLPMLMAVVCYVSGRRSKPLRNALVGATGVAVFALCALTVGRGYVCELPGVCGMGLRFRADGFRSVYCCVASFMWMMTGLFSPEYFAHYHNRNRYYFFNLMTLGATLGVFLSDDLYTTMIFFEIMSMTSYVWVAHEETDGAMRAAATYLAVAVIGGMTTLMGLFLLYHELGTLSFAGMKEAAALLPDRSHLTVAAWLTLVGFAAKAGLFPLHIWLPKAHPVAPAPASALLSGILTKSGVFGMIVVCASLMRGDCFFGDGLLTLGAVTMFLGAALALFSVNLKRVLACSSMSQIGFITVGLSMMVMLGEEGSLAAYGAVMHMMNHSLIKLVLFMAAGVVYMNLHKLDLNDVRGFGRGKPALHIAFLLGALSIACIPPIGSGYNSKSLIHEAILEYIHHLSALGAPTGAYRFVELLFIFSGGLTVAYMLKLYICLFWEKNPEHQAEYDAMNHRYMNRLSTAALLLSALILPFLGALPGRLFSPIGAMAAPFFGQEPLAHQIAYFSAENLLGAAKSIGVGVLAYLLIVRPLLMAKDARGVKRYVNRWPAWLDLEDRVYRPVLLKLLPGVCVPVVRAVAGLPDSKAVLTGVPAAVTAAVRALAELPENLAMALRATVLRARQPRRAVPVGNRVTYVCGRAMDGVAAALNATVLRRRPMRTDFEFVFDASWKEFYAASNRIVRSVSFGLLLLCVGLLVTCVYLIIQ